MGGGPRVDAGPRARRPPAVPAIPPKALSIQRADGFEAGTLLAGRPDPGRGAHAPVFGSGARPRAVRVVHSRGQGLANTQQAAKGRGR